MFSNQAVILLVVLTGTLVVASYDSLDYYAYPKYLYKYGVQDKHTGDFKTAYEERDGPVTRGSYSILQPDGILRTVKYWIDPKSGFKATVINSGLGIHPKIVH